MKKYNVQNYIRHKEDIKLAMPVNKPYSFYTRKELIIKFMPLVENISKKFATSQEASGVMSILDIIQEGYVNLIKAVDKIDWEKLIDSEDVEISLKSFLSKRIRGGIRRAIDKNRGTMRIPEHKMEQIRKDGGKDKKMVAMFFNSIFLSIDATPTNEDMVYQIPDKSDPYNEQLLNAYLLSLLNKYLSENEVFVLSKSYGLDGNKMSAKKIAEALNIKGVSAYVRVSELKKQAVQKLIDNVDHSQVLDYL
jgi:RNA polymerase sigma factor (sigma-70 family)